MKPANHPFLSFVALYLLRDLQFFYLEIFLFLPFFPDGLIHNFQVFIHTFLNSFHQLKKVSPNFFQLLNKFV